MIGDDALASRKSSIFLRRIDATFRSETGKERVT